MAELATIARPYAEAAFAAARGQDAKAWGEQLSALAEVAAHPQLRQFADNPKVEATQVFDVIAGVLKQPLAQEILFGKLIDGGSVRVEEKDGELALNF